MTTYFLDLDLRDSDETNCKFQKTVINSNELPFIIPSSIQPTVCTDMRNCLWRSMWFGHAADSVYDNCSIARCEDLYNRCSLDSCFVRDFFSGPRSIL